MLDTTAILVKTARGFVSEAHRLLDQADDLDRLAAAMLAEPHPTQLLTTAADHRRQRAQHCRTMAGQQAQVAVAILEGLKAVADREPRSRMAPVPGREA